MLLPESVETEDKRLVEATGATRLAAQLVGARVIILMFSRINNKMVENAGASATMWSRKCCMVDSWAGMGYSS
jgi:hypothetical protein